LLGSLLVDLDFMMLYPLFEGGIILAVGGWYFVFFEMSGVFTFGIDS
jgi:hypothetical protein